MNSFASDNYASVCSEVMQALQQVNQGHMPAYGADEVTVASIKTIQLALGHQAPIWFVATGTAANTLSLKQVLKSYQSVICTDTAHIICNETGAPHHICGTKFLTQAHVQGKLTPAAIHDAYQSETCWGIHATQPRVVSISQTTEFGTVYNLKELASLRETCNELGLLLHMDGCRIYNAAASLNCSLSQIVSFVDILSLGGTKAGLMFGEAVVFINQELAEGFEYIQKQGLQLFSKMRYVSAQFQALFNRQLGLTIAKRCNQLTRQLADGLNRSDKVEILYPVDSNMLFIRFPKSFINRLQEQNYFYIMPGTDIARLVISHDIKQTDIDSFLAVFETLNNTKKN